MQIFIKKVRVTEKYVIILKMFYYKIQVRIARSQKGPDTSTADGPVRVIIEQDYRDFVFYIIVERRNSSGGEDACLIDTYCVVVWFFSTIVEIIISDRLFDENDRRSNVPDFFVWKWRGGLANIYIRFGF